MSERRLQKAGAVTIYQREGQALIDAAWNSLAPLTRAAYQSDLNQFTSFCGKEFNQITPADVSRYIDDMRKRDLKNATINRKIASLNKLLRVYVQAGLLQRNPIELLKTVKRISYKTQRNVRSPLEFDTIRTALADPAGYRDVRTVLITRFLARTGCRISETLSAKRSDISQHSKGSDKIMVFGKGQKERFVYLDKKLKSEIFKYFPNKNDLLFCSDKGDAMSRKTFWRILTKFFQRKAGIHVSPHMMRHFFATYKIAVEKMDVKSVSKFLGHSSTATTQDMYVDTVLGEREAGIDL